MSKLNNILGFHPNNDQIIAIENIKKFISRDCQDDVFILKGSAGTGKTSIVKALTHYMYKSNILVRILAPTGRAAKVLAKYSKKSASTIHRKIYWIRTNKNGNTYITLKENTHTNTVFVVDEASMIPESSDKGFGNRSLLDDLIKYVHNGTDCKLILIGDTAQLPPVHLDISPALDEEFLENNYNKWAFGMRI